MNYVTKLLSVLLLISSINCFAMNQETKKEEKSSWLWSWFFKSNSKDINSNKINPDEFDNKEIEDTILILINSLDSSQIKKTNLGSTFKEAFNNPASILQNDEFIENLNKDQRQIINIIFKKYWQNIMIALQDALEAQNKSIGNIKNIDDVLVTAILRDPSALKKCSDFYNLLEEKEKANLNLLINLHKKFNN